MTRVCPDCGEPAESYGLCRPCLGIKVRADRVRKGLPERVTDPVAIASTARILASATPASPPASATGSGVGIGAAGAGVGEVAVPRRSNRKGRPVAAERPLNNAAS